MSPQIWRERENRKEYKRVSERVRAREIVGRVRERGMRESDDVRDE
jgi:hypothetical protein